MDEEVLDEGQGPKEEPIMDDELLEPTGGMDDFAFHDDFDDELEHFKMYDLDVNWENLHKIF